MSTIVDSLKNKFGASGQTIAEAIETIESGGGSGGGGMFFVTIDDNDGSCDKTWGELKAAFEAGMIPVLAYIQYGSETPKYVMLKEVDFASRYIQFDNYMYTGTSDDDPLTPYE